MRKGPVAFVVVIAGLLVVWASHTSSHSDLADALVAESAGGPPSTLAIENDADRDVGVFIAFGSDSVVTPASFPPCRVDAGLTCDFVVEAHTTREIPLGGRYLNATIAFNAPVGCGATKAELNLNNPKWYDTLDVSLVDGFNEPLEIAVNTPDGGAILGPVTSAQGNEKAYGVFPLGCDICVARQSPPCGMKPGKEGCKTGPNQYHPDVICQYQGLSFGGGERVVVKRLAK